MRLCQYQLGQARRVGVRLNDGRILDVSVLTDTPYASMQHLIEDVAANRLQLNALQDRLAALSSAQASALGALPAAQVHLRAPITEPPKFFAIAINGRANFERSIKPENPRPQYFIKLRTCITGPTDAIEIPDIGCVGPEVELAVIIGKGGKHIAEQDAYAHVFGYTIHNDLTAHALRARSEWIKLRRKDGSEEHLTYPGRWKNFDTFSPMGPFLVTRDEIADPHALSMQARLNDDLVQQGTTADVVYQIPELIGYLSAAHTLEPGDIISIGTVPAVAPWTMGTIDLRRYGGVVTAAIDGLGELANPIQAV